MTESEQIIEYYKNKEKPKDIYEGITDGISLMVGLIGTTFIDVYRKRKEKEL